jgi:hypothetical protein
MLLYPYNKHHFCRLTTLVAWYILLLTLAHIADFATTYCLHMLVEGVEKTWRLTSPSSASSSYCTGLWWSGTVTAHCKVPCHQENHSQVTWVGQIWKRWCPRSVDHHWSRRSENRPGNLECCLGLYQMLVFLLSGLWHYNSKHKYHNCVEILSPSVLRFSVSDLVII